jgi:hypothetical protein
MARTLAGLLALILAANGLAMLFASLWWYGAVPGVTATGPYNPHFVRDIGATYVATAAALAAYAWKPREAWPALVPAALFLTLHSAIHVFDAVCGTKPLADTARDFAGVHLPTLIALGLLAARPGGIAALRRASAGASV